MKGNITKNDSNTQDSLDSLSRENTQNNQYIDGDEQCIDPIHIEMEGLADGNGGKSPITTIC